MLRAMDGLYYWFGDMGLDSETSSIFAFLLFCIIFLFVIALIEIIFRIIAEWIFFTKCGEKGWKALIPIYNEITLVKLSGLNWWWIFLIYASSIYSIFFAPIQFLIIATGSLVGSIISLIFSLISMGASVTAIIARVNECNNISKKFNKGAGHSALIFFFEPIMFLIMGLSKDYEYDKELDVPNNGFFGNK